ncbi:hypothetical protein Leryth_024519 [Lithospermum erythrorhizon]|nr:hypothetical protein Leryth_024519 [Lithospermum erythrorhizon]
MGNANCSCKPRAKSEGDKRSKTTSKHTNRTKNVKNLQVQIEHPIILSKDNLKSTLFSAPTVPLSAVPRSKVKVMNLDSPVTGEQAYEGEDEYDDMSMSMKRDNSDFDLQAHCENSIEIKEKVYDSFRFDVNDRHDVRTDKDAATDDEVINKARSGHMSDPGFGKADQFSASPQLKRSCSDPMMRDMVKDTGNLPCSNSFEEMQKLTQKMNDEIIHFYYGSPLSMRSHFSADKVMLKKHSSSQILPSRSQKLWWKLFLWSHRNLHGATQPKLITNQQGGYSSDTIEARKSMESSKSPRSFTRESMRVGDNNIDDNRSWGGFQGNAGFWPQNQWVAFPAESSTLSRVEKWVRELPVDQPLDNDSNDHTEDGAAIPPPDVVEHLEMNITEEIVHANSVIQSLNSSTSVAHMAGIGLKVIPSISCYSSLRSVNLSGNSIVHITPGSLPKGLHVLDLSRNKISTIEGLRELTHLRVLNLSYNRISRIGQGLSNCILIKELYLAGNKISEVEGLHRLLKLTILDLSFNKIITTKALGQLVANYNSLLALNLLGNPVQSNISDDQLRKTLCSLLPKLAYLNRQPISSQKAREVRSEAILKAAMGDGSRSKRKKPVKRVNHGTPSSSSVYSSKIHSAHKSRHSSKSRTYHHSALKKSSLQPSTSY